MDLAQHLFGTHCCICFDNFYTSTELLLDLQLRGVNACGTIRLNQKGPPKDLLPANLSLVKHEHKVTQKDGLTFCCWMDTKPVLLLSNFHDPTGRGTVKRRNGSQKQTVVVPFLVEDYQKNMQWVDLADQMVSYYMLNHRSRKWWRRIFFHLMLTRVHNAFIICQDSHPDVAKSNWPNFQVGPGLRVDRQHQDWPCSTSKCC